MRIEEHKKALEEHERDIKRCIDGGLEEKLGLQCITGGYRNAFHTSA